MLTKIEPKVSVIIPVYNVEKYLRKCLDSLINQSFADIEIICIDDGSTDNSLEILNEFAEKDERFVILTQENQGPGVARNKGLEIAKGEYIGFVDPDDWVNSNFFESLYNEAKTSDYDIVKGIRADFIDKVLKFKKDNFSKSQPVFPNLFFGSWLACLYKSSIIKEHNIRFPSTFSLEDVAFMLLYITFVKKYSFAKNAIYYYLHREDSLSPQGKSLERSLQSFESRLYAFKLIQGYNISKEDYLKSTIPLIGSLAASMDRFFERGYHDKLDCVTCYIDEILSSLKYKEEFLSREAYQFLAKRDFSEKIFIKRAIKKKYNKLGFLKKMFSVSNVYNYKLIVVLGFRFVLERSLT